MLRRDAQKIAEEDASHCDFRARKRFNQRFPKYMEKLNKSVFL
jgi:hypothetical protein